MKSAQIRDAFLNFFASKQHEILASSSLVPGNDPTLLFTNAGMVQFKDVFLGSDKRPYNRATTSQRCVRAGGKHNDLENVGYTARHHTFFEMLGNFSFGDYFKRDAIQYAWELLTGDKWFALPKDKLWVTVYASDDEAYDIWTQEVGIPAERMVRIGDNKGAPYASDNFWAMGDTGPCGPCTEIFYDHGEHIWGGPPGSPEEDGDRFIEIWNVVFMQFNRSASGEMTPLPKPSVDTGMGLERIAAVLQGVHSNYEIDLFQALIGAAAKVTGCTDLSNDSLKVIADHIRSCAFLIVDGVLPSNEGRGYVLRRIVRRALRHGHKLGVDGLFFHKLVATLAEQMGEAYPELVSKRAQVEKVLKAEEEQFARTLDKGMGVLEAALAELNDKTIPGEVIFQLYDTYGFPVDLTNDIAREREFSLDMDGYERAMEAQRQRARAASRFGVDYSDALKLDGSTIFTGYEGTSGEGKIVALMVDGQPVEAAVADQSVVVVLDQTPFYAESGGQVGDCGYLTVGDTKVEVTDCRKEGGHHLHIGKVLQGEVNVGHSAVATVDKGVRAATARNHSATHLLHAALREILGDHVAQQGSMVDSERLRFDFSNPEAVSGDMQRQLERRVNAEIRGNTPVATEVMSMDAAKAKGAMALFGEKYGDEVRVLTMGDDAFSVELCGGTHVARTGDIGFFKITAESSVAAGVRRIEAVTGAGAEQLVDEMARNIDQVAGVLKTSRTSLLDKALQLQDDNRQLQRQLDQLKQQLAQNASGDLLAQISDIGGVPVLITQIDGMNGKALRTLGDEVKSKLPRGVFLLAGTEDGKVALLAGVTGDLTGQVKAGELLGIVAEKVGGKGGGRPDLAQGGGTDAGALPAALDHARQWLSEKFA